MQIDPLADNFTYQSPYASMDNNPISNTDPDGLFSRFGAWWRNIWWDGDGIVKNDKTGEWGVKTSGTDWDGTVMVQETYKGNPNAFPNQIKEHYIEQMELKQFWEESGFETRWVDTKEEQVTSFIQVHGILMTGNTAPQITAKIAAVKGVTNFTLKNLSSFRGAKSADVIKWLKQNGWIGQKTNPNRVYNDGMRFTNGVKGEQIRIMSGGATRSIPAKTGPYMEISINGQKTVIELFGNPTL